MRFLYSIAPQRLAVSKLSREILCVDMQERRRDMFDPVIVLLAMHRSDIHCPVSICMMSQGFQCYQCVEKGGKGWR